MKKNLWERATVAALVLGTAGWLTGGCGNETQEVSTNTLIPFSSPSSSVIPAGTIALTGAAVPAGTSRIDVRFTQANGQTATTTGTQSAAGVITAPTPAGFSGTSTVTVTYVGANGASLGSQTTTANLVSGQTATAQLGVFVAPSPTASPSPSTAPSPSPSPSPSVVASPTAGLTGLVVRVNGVSTSPSVNSGASANLTAVGNTSTGPDVTAATTFSVTALTNPTGNPGNITGTTYNAPTVTGGNPPPPPTLVNITGKNGTITNSVIVTINAPTTP